MSNLQIQVSDQTLNDYDLLREECGRVDLPAVSLLMMRGEDRKGWLQGQATNDLRKLENGASNQFCLTSVTGHLVSVCEAWAASDRILITCPRSTLDAVLKRVDQMVILEDVAVEEVSNSYRLISVQGPAATSQLSELVPLPSLDAGESQLCDTPVYCLRSNRTGMGGWDVWIPLTGEDAIEAVEKRFAPIGHEAYNIARLETGIPMFGSDMGERTMPPEMGPAFVLRHISYSKGCYLGQEVLMRIHSRGHTNRTWVGLQADAPIEIGATVSHLRRPDAGTVTSSAFSPDYGYIGAAMIRNEAAFEGEIVQIMTEQGTVDAEVRIMPFLKMG